MAFTNPEKNVLISTPIVSSDYFSYFYFESRNTRRNRNVYQFHAAKEKKADDFLFISSLVQFVQFELETFLGRNGFQVNAKIMETKFM